MKIRLDKFLVDKGIFESRAKAQAMIMAGEISVHGVVINKPGTPVPDNAVVAVRERMPYVSRGGVKLHHALDAFNLTPAGIVCMDIGASTGGFTDCLLQRGALKVYAIDVGHGQLHATLKNNPRVVVMEGVNFRYFSPASIREPIGFVTIDVSFISLDKIIPVAAGCLTEAGIMVAMVKPQFEATPKDLRKGVVRDESVRQQAIAKIKLVAVEAGLQVCGGADAAIKGPQGNLEHFLYLKKNRCTGRDA